MSEKPNTETDIETVLQGLKCCCDSEGNCQGCAYDTKLNCNIHLMQDAIAVIEQYRKEINWVIEQIVKAQNCAT